MPRLSRIRYYVTEAVLWIAAAIGLVAIVLVVCAYLFNTSIIMFRTGSMEPTIPAGSAALVREIPASEVAVGDVLTVDRPDRLPVTHRVTSVEPGETTEERVITMQGDANESPDPAPYTITEARVLLGSVPGLANPINQLNNPYVLGGVTLAAALLVGWAFWPRNDRPSQTSAEPPTPEQNNSGSGSGPRHARCVIGVLVVASLLPISDQVHASPVGDSADDLVEETITSRYITLTSVYEPSSRLNLAAGTTSFWDLGIDIDAPSEGQARTGLSASGAFPLQVTVLSCSTRWEGKPTTAYPINQTCAEGYRVIGSELFVAPDDEVTWIEEFSSEHAPWLRLMVELPRGFETSMANNVSLKVHAQAQGDEISTDTDLGRIDESTPDDQVGLGPGQEETSPREPLAQTGFSVLLLLFVAVGAVVLGRMLQYRNRNHDPVSKGDGRP